MKAPVKACIGELGEGLRPCAGCKTSLSTLLQEVPKQGLQACCCVPQVQ